MDRRGRACAIFVAAMLGAQSAVAAGPSFTERYKAAVKMENEGKVADALAAFEAISPEERDWNVRLHIAGCKKKLGKLLAAAKEYESIRTDATADQATKDTAASDLEDLQSKIPRVRVTLSVATRDVSVFFDGEAIASLPASLSVDPGPHVVTAKRGAGQVFERRVEMSEGTTIDVLVDAPVLAAAAPAPANPTATADRPETSMRTYAVVSGGVAVLALGVGTYYLFRTQSLVDSRDELAARGDPAAFDAADDARSAQWGARIGMGVGLVATVAAGVLWFGGSSAKSPAAKSGYRLGSYANGGWGLSLQGSW